MRRAVTHGRRPTGLLGTVGRTAVIVGTAAAASEAVDAGQQEATDARPAPTPPSPAQPSDDLISRLGRLGRLKADGVLTQEEFDRQKAILLAGGSS